jgi:menaquinone-9 beta-reductase
MTSKASQATFDVIVIGAGPGGSSVASFLASRGVSCAIVDRAKFPREKVCGDGLTPQALYWLGKLGCAGDVLDRTDCCIDTCDLFINGKRILTGAFPQRSAYPGFCTLLPRKELDDILVRHACRQGASFFDEWGATSIKRSENGVIVEGKTDSGPRSFRAKILIGADGAGSMVSRFLNNKPTAGTKALSVRAYFSGVKREGSPIKVCFDEYLFPGYGWIFINDSGVANVGVGCVRDELFSSARPPDLQAIFKRFIASPAAACLSGARQTSSLAGGWAAFSLLGAITADNVMLIGDAAHHADPLNGGGIHKAMEDAALAADVALEALASGDYSNASLKAYEERWSAISGADWRSAELLLAFAKNRDLRSVYLTMLESIGTLCENDGRFADYCAGVFSGVVAQRSYLSPITLLSKIPVDPRSLFGKTDMVRSALSLSAKSALSFFQAGRDVLRNPLENIDWALEVGKKIIDTGFYLAPRQTPQCVQAAGPAAMTLTRTQPGPDVRAFYHVEPAPFSPSYPNGRTNDN